MCRARPTIYSVIISEMTARYCVFVVCLALCHASVSDVLVNDPAPMVETATATFRGKRININPYQLPDFHGAVAAYTRIPYAEPPVGDLRFRRPVAKVIEGEFDATRGPITCPQITLPGMDFGLDWSEDCLFLDVFVPEPKPTSAAVMVWIHGGGFHTGAGSVPKSLPTSLAAMNDVIVVTCNYRVNVFGFLSSGDEEIEANVGLLDQRQVLIWVKENIAAFGGDPGRVTIFGESAGGASVHLQVLSPMSAGLFTGAIMQSGVATAESHTTLERARGMAFAMGEKMNCTATTTSELAECLRAISAEDIVANFLQDPLAMLDTAVRPVVDGEFLPKSVKELTADGSHNDVNILMGSNEDEGYIFVSPVMAGGEGSDKPVFDEASFKAIVGGTMQTADPLVLDMVSFVYVSQEELDKPEPNYADATAMFMTDYIFVCDTFNYAERFADADQSSVFVYFLTHVPSSSMWGSNFKWMGATHGEDIPYVFGSPFMYESEDDTGDSLLVGHFDEEETQMSLQVMKYWSNFAKTGNPNLSSKDGEPADAYSYWPNFTGASPSFKEISKTFTNANNRPTPKRCDFRLNHLPKLMENSAELARLKSLLEEEVNADSEKSCEDPASCPGE